VNWKVWLPLSLLILVSTVTRSEVILNWQTPTPTKAEVVQAFSGELKYWENGDKVVIFILPSSHWSTRLFAYSILGVSPTKFMDLVTRDGLSNVHQLNTEAQVLLSVARVRGSIGYLSLMPLSDTGVENEYVKVLNLQ